MRNNLDPALVRLDDVDSFREVKAYPASTIGTELARLFVAYRFLCPRDGLRIAAGKCKCGYSPAYRILTLDLPLGKSTPDKEINDLSMREQYVVVEISR